ncbi:MAG: response regulator, partial [Gemmatimonadaceae bacterium]|nr:response regulator [Gemmatimonadaceae bacterium]
VEVDVATSVVDFEGRPALLCTVTDMTETRALQRRMTEAEKVEAVGLLAGGVAHDFNNLLTGILAWVDIASDDVDPLGPVANALFEIRVSAERAAELTRQLLAFGRRQLLDPRPLDLGEAAVRLKRWMDRALGANHRLLVTVPEVTWPIRADRTEVERALTALVMNAQDAMPAGGDIALTVDNVTLTADRAASLGSLRQGDHVVVTVRDSGVGMDDATRRRIFDPFFTTKPQGAGTGLGLAAVQGTVLQLGGAIEVITSPGAGATFRLHFPRLADPAEPSTGPSREPMPQRVPRTVLVVEDDPQLGRILRRILVDGGHMVRLAASPAEAETLAADPVDLVVCDVELPGRNGADLVGALRARQACRAAILISGRPITDDELIRAGRATVRLQKPFRPQPLLQAVEDVMRMVPGR